MPTACIPKITAVKLCARGTTGDHCNTHCRTVVLHGSLYRTRCQVDKQVPKCIAAVYYRKGARVRCSTLIKQQQRQAAALAAALGASQVERQLHSTQEGQASCRCHVVLVAHAMCKFTACVCSQHRAVCVLQTVTSGGSADNQRLCRQVASSYI